jgi:hypothetical protein
MVAAVTQMDVSARGIHCLPEAAAEVLSPSNGCGDKNG